MNSFDPIPPSQPEVIHPTQPIHAETRETPPFSWIDLLLIVVVAFFAAFLCLFLGMAVYVIAHPSRPVNPKDMATNALFLIPVQIAAYILTVGFMAGLSWQKYKMSLLEAVGWNMPGAKSAWLALASGTGLAIAAQLLSGLLAPWMPKSPPIEQFFTTAASAYALAIFGIMVAPVVEELFFRGLLYPTLARSMGVAPALVLTAGGFALIHASQLGNAWAPLVVLFLVGLVLTGVRARFKSVAVCVCIHVGYNFTLFALAFIQTHGFTHMERAS